MRNDREIIFYDTEFTLLDPKRGELLSIGMVKNESDETLYLELERPPEDTMDPWVIEHVLPYLHGTPVSKDEARAQIMAFMGPDHPYLMAYVNQFDSMYWYSLFGDAKQHPAFWIPIDFASILFAHGFDPQSMGRQDFFDRIGVKRAGYDIRPHNALSDAQILKETYQKFVSYIGNAK